MGISDISLTTGIRSSMLSGADASKKLSRAEERLATGKKVNSALDQPTSFFAAMQLKQYADDASQLHDGINETISIIRAATHGISAISRLLQDMKAVVEGAGNATDPAAKARYAAAYDELYAQLNMVASDSSYRGTNLIGDSDPSLLRWRADNISVSLSTSSSSYTIEGEFLGSGYALYGADAPETGWVPDARGTLLFPATGDITEIPATESGSKLDFLFVIDTTGSMGGTLAQVEANVSAFIDNLEAAGVDGRYAFAKYGDVNPGDGGDAPVIEPPVFFSDSASFASALASSADSGGGGDGPESGLEGILASLSTLSFRPDAVKRMLLITDATVHTTDDGKSADTIAGTAAVLADAGIRLDVAAPVGGAVETQLLPLATLTGGVYHDISDPSFYTGGFGVSSLADRIATLDLAVESADYDAGTFSIRFNNPPPPRTRAMKAERAGLSLFHSWAYRGFQTREGVDAAEKAIASAIEVVRTVEARFGSGSDILTIRDTFLSESVEISITGAEKLTSADLNEEAANVLMMQTRLTLSTTSLTISSQSAENILKLL